MALIVLGGYAVQFPLGGYMSWVLQWLSGLGELGNDVYFVERADHTGSCYDPAADRMTDDPRAGVEILGRLLTTIGLEERWCFADVNGNYHGLSRRRVEELLASADLFIDMGVHGVWEDESANAARRVLVDGEPAETQMKMALSLADGTDLPEYDAYFSVGQNIGTPNSTAPTAGRAWKHLFYPVACSRIAVSKPPPDAAFTTVMSWAAHRPTTFEGVTYGQKDVEFEKFIDLPSLTEQPIELAVAGNTVPSTRLREAGFRLVDAHAASRSFGDFWEYIRGSCGEFSVAKNVFVATNSGWFGDRACAYLAAGRPVVMQETGFSAHLPCGEGLFAVRTADEAAEAIDAVASDFPRHSKAARAIALEHLDTRPVLRRFLADAGLD
jgi:hypothetical protein